MGHAAAVPGARRRAGRDARPHQRQPVRHALRLPPRLLRRRRARVPRLRHGRAVGHRGVRRCTDAVAGPPTSIGVARAAGADPTWFHTGLYSADSADSSPAARDGEYYRAAGLTPTPRRDAPAARHGAAGGLTPTRSARRAARSRARCCARRSTRSTARRQRAAPLHGPRAELHRRAAPAAGRQPARGVLHPPARDAQPTTTSATRPIRGSRTRSRWRSTPSATCCGRSRSPTAARRRRYSDASADQRPADDGAAHLHGERASPTPVDDGRRTTARRSPPRPATYELTGFAPAAGTLRFSFAEWARTGFAPTRQRTGSPQAAALGDTRPLPAERPDRPPAAREPRVARPPGRDVSAGADAGARRRRLRAQANGQPDEELLPTPAPCCEGAARTSAATSSSTAAGGSRAGRSSTRTLRRQRPWSWPRRQHTSSFPACSAIRSATRRSSATAQATCSSTRTQDARRQRHLGAERLPRAPAATDHGRAIGNQVAVLFDALGLVVATAMMGKVGESLGDLLEGVDPDPRRCPRCERSWRTRRRNAASMLGKATTRIVYDLDRFTTRRRSRRSPPRWRARRTSRPRPRAAVADPDRLLLLRRLRTGDPEEDPSRAGRARHAARRPRPTPDIRPGALVRDAAGKPRRGRRAAPLGRLRADGLQQQGQAGQAVRALLQRHAPLRARGRADRDRRQPGPVLRPGRARRRHAAPEPHLREGRRSTPGSRRPTTSTTPSPARRPRPATRAPTPTSPATSRGTSRPSPPAGRPGTPQRSRRAGGRAERDAATRPPRTRTRRPSRISTRWAAPS